MPYIHLGIDYGTSATKIVARDYAAAGGEKTYPLKWRTSEHNQYRLPSCVATTSRHAWFGLQPGAREAPADAAWHYSMKMRVAAQHCADEERVRVYARALRELTLPAGWGYQTLFVASLVWIIRRALDQSLNVMGHTERDVRYGVTFGLPTDFRHNASLSRFFLHRYRAAYGLARDEELCRRFFPPQRHDVALDDALRRAIMSGLDESERAGDDDIEYWHQSEARASVLWGWNSPVFAPGAYLHVDVGAGTTNVVAYIVKEQNGRGGGKAGFCVLSSQSGPVGLDAFAAGSAKFDVGRRLREEPRLVDQLRSPYRHVFGGVRKKTGDGTAWDQWARARIVLLGGGSSFPELEPVFAFHPTRSSVQIEVVDLTAPPPDLQLGLSRGTTGSQLTREHREARRSLAIAYGLSLPGAMLPEERRPDEVPPIETPRRVATQTLEGFYAK